MKAFTLTIIFTTGLSGCAPSRVTPRPGPTASLYVTAPDEGPRPDREARDSECAERQEFFGRLCQKDEAGGPGCTALMRAAAHGRLDAVRALLRRGAGVNREGPLGLTALMLAAGQGHHEVVKTLLSAGADPNAAGGIAHVGSWSVLTMAMSRCNGNWTEIVDTLIAGGAKVNPPAGVVPLTYAIEQRRDPVLIRALLERGADVNFRGGAPLDAAVTDAEPDVEIVRVLLAAGADPNLPRINAGDEEVSLLAYLEQYIEYSKGGKHDETDKAREEIVRLLKQAGAKR